VGSAAAVVCKSLRIVIYTRHLISASLESKVQPTFRAIDDDCVRSCTYMGARCNAVQDRRSKAGRDGDSVGIIVISTKLL
jgi:hypothetical protein